MFSPAPSRAERFLATLLILWAVVLHGLFFLSAGALWRDEASSVQQARLPHWSDLWNSLAYDSFPALYPALLRVWSGREWEAGDHGLRVLGLIVGLGCLASIWLIARLLGSRAPLIVLVLLAADPIVISEGDSIRPYGLSLLALLWSVTAMARYLATPSAFWFGTATFASVLSVQLSYTNTLILGASSLCAMAVAFWTGERRRIWRLLVPAAVASLTLLPYRGTLERARAWVSILHFRVDWAQYLRDYVAAHSAASIIAWGVVAILAVAALALDRAAARRMKLALNPLWIYCGLVAMAGVAVQIAFVALMRVPPFPRYFLASAALLVLACDLWLQNRGSRVRVAAALVALALMAWPSWSWLRQRRTNVDLVAKVLTAEAKQRDLVVISPWFLHPGFQRYYRGKAEWVTVPVLERGPMTRYDLVKQAMFEPDPAAQIGSHIRAALDRGGAVWCVSQADPQAGSDRTAPDPPPRPRQPDGYDYERFRSFWERDIVYRLRACCEMSPWSPETPQPVWQEERLVLTRWERAGR